MTRPPAVAGGPGVATSDPDLVRAFLATRDEGAFRALYRRHTPYLYALAGRLAGADGEVDDLVEDTWVRAVRKLGGFRWRSELRTWLAGILVNRHREAVRARGRDRTVAVDAATLPAPAAAPDTALALDEALGRLPDGYREVVVLYHVYGYRHREIGALLGIAEGTSKSQLARGLTRLRELLA